MPGLGQGRRPAGATGHAVWAPFADRRFLRLLAFGCWFSFFSGLTSPAQDLYLRDRLDVALLVSLALTIGMRVGQGIIGPRVGRLADRFGNRPVMIASVLLVAAAPLWYLAATPKQWGWIVGAWVLWVAWAGINVCLPNLMLNLSPRQNNIPYIATYYAVTGLCVAASMIAGGVLYDRFRGATFCLASGWPKMDYFQAVFLFGWLARSLAVVWLVQIAEPRGAAL